MQLADKIGYDEEEEEEDEALSFEQELERYQRLGEKQGSVIVELRMPIKVSGIETSEVELRRPKVGEVRRTDGKSEAAAEMFLIARCAGISEQELNRMDITDYRMCGAVMLGFLSSRAPRKPRGNTNRDR